MPEIIYERCRDCRLLDICDPNYNSEPACFQKAMESQTTVVQQLQAKIAALTIRLETYVRDACLEDKEVFDIADKMRQLSAMQ